MTINEQERLNRFFREVCNSIGEVPRRCSTCSFKAENGACAHPLNPNNRIVVPWDACNGDCKHCQSLEECNEELSILCNLTFKEVMEK